MNLREKKEICRDLDRAMDREWLETNSIDRWICMFDHHRYEHAALPRPAHDLHGRFVALSKLEETLTLPGVDAFELSSNSSKTCA